MGSGNLYLSSKVWLRGEVLQARCHVGVASGLVDGSNQAIREEGAHTLGVAQAVHVDQLLGCAREGQASHICWEVVDVGVWHSNGAWVSGSEVLGHPTAVRKTPVQPTSTRQMYVQD